MNEKELKDFAQMWYHIGISYYTFHPPNDIFETAWNQFKEDFKTGTELIKRFEKIVG